MHGEYKVKCNAHSVQKSVFGKRECCVMSACHKHVGLQSVPCQQQPSVPFPVLPSSDQSLSVEMLHPLLVIPMLLPDKRLYHNTYTVHTKEQIHSLQYKVPRKNK